MDHLRFGRSVVVMIAGLSLFAGCGAHNAVAPTALTPQRVTASSHAGASWMLPAAKKKKALVYATNGCGGTCVLSYPDGKVVGSLPVGGYINAGACVDRSGDVFIADNESVVEYASGGTNPISTLSLPGDNAGECAVDPTTGNLAVLFVGNDAGVAIFAGAQGSPTTYSAGISGYGCGYDAHGNLFVSGENGELPGLAELPQGSSQFAILSVSYEVGTPGQVQWDGKYVTYEGRTQGQVTLSRLSISGSQASIVGVTQLKGISGNAYLSSLYGGKVIVPFGHHGKAAAPSIGVWDYPGGQIKKRYSKFAKPVNFQAVTLSVKS